VAGNDPAPEKDGHEERDARVAKSRADGISATASAGWRASAGLAFDVEKDS